MAVFAFANEKWDVRHFAKELLELLEKWLSEVKITPIVACVPIIREPIFERIDYVRFVRRDVGNYRFFAAGARAFVEISFVSPGKPALFAADWAKGWLGDREFFVEFAVWVRYLEVLLASFAGWHG